MSKDWKYLLFASLSCVYICGWKSSIFSCLLCFLIFRVISEQDEKFSCFVGLGVNPFVTVQLSFLPESERRCTRTAATTFCPEFDHHMEASCDLLLHMSSGETCSLAEQLEQASAVFTVWNRDNHKGLRESLVLYSTLQ